MEKIESVHRAKIIPVIRPILNRPIEMIRAVLKNNKQFSSYIIGIPAMTIELNRQSDGRFDITVKTEPHQ